MSEYNQYGIYFTYPDNWVLEENAMKTIGGSLSVSDESGAFWTLQKYPLGTNPDDILQEAVKTMQEEYVNVECDPLEKVLFDKLIVGVEMTFFYLDLMNVATILCFEQAEQTFAVFWQAGNQLMMFDDKTVPIEKVMEAITYSLLRGK